jgi:lipopolysaccharide heptosyltransferase I
VSAEPARGGPDLVTDLARRPRIAIVKLSSLGDVVHALPVARAIRRTRPDAEITWIVEAREAAVLRSHPDVDRVLAIDTRRWRRGLARPRRLLAAVREVAALRRDLRAARFDVALELQGLVKSGVLTAWTRAPLRIGFASGHCRERWSSVATNRRLTPPADAAHVVDQYLSLLEPLGIAPAAPEFHVPIRPVADRRMEEFLVEQGVKGSDPLVGINPGAGRPDKLWPAAHFATLADRLALECGARILLLWGPNEVHLAREIRDRMSARAIFAPPTDLDELTGLLRRASLVVAADTGPLHLAAALGTPCVGLYGPTRAERNGPYGARCRGLEGPDGVMANLRPDAVFAAAHDVLTIR